MSEGPVLELAGLSKSFGGLNAVRGVTLKVLPGERKAIIGPNGAGKTTLFNLISGVLPSTSGAVRLRGQDITRWSSFRRTRAGMARTFQVTSLFPKLTVLDNLLLALAGVRRTKFVVWRALDSYPDLREKAQRLLESVGYWERRNVEVRNLSHGEQRQIEIVMGLAADPGESREMAVFLKGLDPDLAILLIEHDMDVVFDVVSDISVLQFGEVVEEGSIEQIRSSAKVQQIYLGTG